MKKTNKAKPDIGRPRKGLDQVRDIMRRKHYNVKNRAELYPLDEALHLFHQKQHSREMGAREIEAFLAHLAVKRSFRVWLSPAAQKMHWHLLPILLMSPVHFKIIF